MLEVTVLAEERSAVPGLAMEHGLSLFLDRDGRKLLFDTGQGPTAADNARRLGIDLTDIEGIVLSHGHYDHTGGLKSILGISGPKKIFTHPGVFGRKQYRVREGKSPRYIGIPDTAVALEKQGGILDFSSRMREIFPGIFLSGEVARSTRGEGDEPFLTVREGRKYLPDPFREEQFMAIMTREEMILITGCCHAGLTNTVLHAHTLWSGRKVASVIGGLHLRSADHSVLAGVVRLLKKEGTEKIFAGHCTGEKAEKVLGDAFKGYFQPLMTGGVYRF